MAVFILFMKYEMYLYDTFSNLENGKHDFTCSIGPFEFALFDEYQLPCIEKANYRKNFTIGCTLYSVKDL